MRYALECKFMVLGIEKQPIGVDFRGFFALVYQGGTYGMMGCVT